MGQPFNIADRTNDSRHEYEMGLGCGAISAVEAVVPENSSVDDGRCKSNRA